MASLALATVLLGDVAYQAAMHVRWRRWVNRYAVAAQPPATRPASSRPASPSAGGPGSKPIQVSAAIRRRNPFGPPVKKGHNLILTGVLGNMAFFRNQNNPAEMVTIIEGGSDKGVTVQSINGYEVTILYEGKPQVMKLFDGPGGQPPPVAAPGPPGGGPEMPRVKGGGPVPPSAAPPAPPAGGARVMKGEPPTGVVIEGNVPPEVLEKMQRPVEINR
ncbi:MAG: hypothetical protein AMXMBFR83_16750 [Phycisphaerae bacterium]